LNVFNFTGNLGKDCEQRFIASGESVVQFSVAVKSGFGDKSVTTWVRCSYWGKRSDGVKSYLLKGQLVGISGELTLKEFTNKEGQKQSSLEVRVNDLTLLGKADHDSAPAQRPAPKPQAEPSGASDFSDFSDDIPF